nr:JmjC domain-containing protein [Tanacetum cinerariifolium]
MSLVSPKGDEAAIEEQEIDLDALHKLANMSLGGDSTVEAAYTIYKASHDAHAFSAAGHDAAAVPDDTTMPFRYTLPAGEGIPAAPTTIPTGNTPIPAGRSMDPADQAAADAPTILTAVDKGKAPMVDDSLPADLLSEQERILKNLYDSQLGEELAKKLHAEQEAEFARQQEELAQKAQAERVVSPVEHCAGLSDQRRRELDAAQLIYTEADWLELMAKIATNSALSKQLLGDDVNEENINERLGILLMRKRRELAEQSQVKPMTKTQQRDYMRDFVKNQSASVYNQGWTMKQVPASVSPGPSVPAAVSVPADAVVHSDESHLDDPPTASEHVSTEPTVDVSTPSSSRIRRKHLSKKRVTLIVDIADAALIKFDSASDSDDDPLPYALYAGWGMVPSPLGFIHAYYDMEGHTKHFTSLHELLHIVDKNDLRRLLGTVDDLYQREEPDTFALIL